MSDFETTSNEAIPSFAEFAKKAKEELANRPGGIFMSKLPPGDYAVQYLGATMVPNTFVPGQYVPEYKFNHEGQEKSFKSSSNSLAAALDGRIGQTVILRKGLNAKTAKTFWEVK